MSVAKLSYDDDDDDDAVLCLLHSRALSDDACLTSVCLSRTLGLGHRCGGILWWLPTRLHLITIFVIISEKFPHLVAVIVIRDQKKDMFVDHVFWLWRGNIVSILAKSTAANVLRQHHCLPLLNTLQNDVVC